MKWKEGFTEVFVKRLLQFIVMYIQYKNTLRYHQGCSANKKVWERTQNTSHFKTASNSF